MTDNSFNVPVAILMATYNGERYLSEQIDSILRQTYTDWHLYVHDDGSTDNTMDILNQYRTTYPDKLTILEYAPQGGACNNFVSLMQRVEAELYMFADQDDIWYEDKIALTVQMGADCIESHCPFMVHTDLRVIDTDMNEISPSFWKYSNIKPEFVQTLSEHVICVATGCTMLFNKALRDKALSHLSPHILMHDSLVMCACLASEGTVRALHTATIDYRQHGNNTLGAQPADRINLTYRICHLLNMLKSNYRQWRMLNVFGHVSVIKYIASKIRYSNHSK